jgi:Glycerophosphoryl diester phosphodiesterase family
MSGCLSFKVKFWLIAVAWVGGLIVSGLSEEPSRPLAQAHAHNDYEHARPLLDALDHGFMSVEADVFLIDGRLLVAHDRAEVKPERTLESLYLAPLAERVKRHGGKVHRGGNAFTLLIDFKSAAAETWTVLRALLEKHREMLTEFSQGAVHERAVTVILSGNRPVEILKAEDRRLAFIDGRPDDLEADSPATLVPLVSAAWSTIFSWRGDGRFPDDQRAKLVQLTTTAHAQGKRIRFWGTRDDKATWDVLLAAGVDFLNADDLAKLREYLKQANYEPTQEKELRINANEH